VSSAAPFPINPIHGLLKAHRGYWVAQEVVNGNQPPVISTSPSRQLRAYRTFRTTNVNRLSIPFDVDGLSNCSSTKRNDESSKKFQMHDDELKANVDRYRKCMRELRTSSTSIGSSQNISLD